MPTRDEREKLLDDLRALIPMFTELSTLFIDKSAELLSRYRKIVLEMKKHKS